MGRRADCRTKARAGWTGVSLSVALLRVGGLQAPLVRSRHRAARRRGFCRPERNLGREMQPRDELTDHGQAQGPLPAQNFRNLALAADILDQITARESRLLYA